MRGRDERGGLGIADGFLLLLLLLGVGGALFRAWDLHRGGGVETETLTVHLRWSGVEERTLACLEEGEILYTASGEVFGQVSEIVSNSPTVEVKDGSLTVRGTLSEGSLRDADVTVEVEGRRSEGLLLLDGRVPLSVGETLRLYSDRAAPDLTVKAFS